ncbi:transporter, DASS family [Leptospira fainei serovar Hurstbridge str. BUT 6]|uniref:Transporter, DASS family n=1 Tax=Leptospira fainei serovar Hurstbridge str. BUT 6 TaxID=1193011 RepID=S3V348_9LEPT|nr:DASS family sodium-coupled anion symporter [Leptospira fainei]EPG75858.1 transporter, DASS family [Leptospira fainei serovar Hurstbridge str. BUT 6]
MTNTFIKLLISVLLSFLPPLCSHFGLLPYSVGAMFSILLLAACFWIFEVIPGHATSLLVIFLEILLFSNPGKWEFLNLIRPIGGKNPAPNVFLAAIADSAVILFLGSFALAKGCVKVGVDRWLANRILPAFGDSPRFVLMGLMLVTAGISLWMSNTATASLMIALVFPLLQILPTDEKFRKGILIGIPFAANLGGIGTPIGSPPNIIAFANLKNHGFGDSISFGSWMLVAIPLLLILLFFAWIWILKAFPPSVDLKLSLRFVEESDKASKRKLHFVLASFLCTVCLWLSESFHGIPAGVVAMLPLILFTSFGILDSSDIRSLEWDVLILVAGGIALGTGIEKSGAGEWFGSLIGSKAGPGESLWVLALFFSVGLFLSTFLSNTATANLLVPLALPVAALLLPGDEAYVIQLVLGTALGASLAMSLPVSTPPNAVAYAVGGFEIKDMAKIGIRIGLLGLALVLLGFFVFG